MGPPAFAGGNLVGSGEPGRKCWAASMGPPAFAGGNTSISSMMVRASACFNGATGFRRWKRLWRYSMNSSSGGLQWGHRLSPVETTTSRKIHRLQSSFNGATGFRRWKPDQRRCRCLSGRCFNGATGFRRWKRLLGLLPSVLPRASMGPPAFAGGNQPEPR